MEFPKKQKNDRIVLPSLSCQSPPNNQKTKKLIINFETQKKTHIELPLPSISRVKSPYCNFISQTISKIKKNLSSAVIHCILNSENEKMFKKSLLKKLYYDLKLRELRILENVVLYVIKQIIANMQTTIPIHFISFLRKKYHLSQKNIYFLFSKNKKQKKQHCSFSNPLPSLSPISSFCKQFSSFQQHFAKKNNKNYLLIAKYLISQNSFIHFNNFSVFFDSRSFAYLISPESQSSFQNIFNSKNYQKISKNKNQLFNSFLSNIFSIQFNFKKFKKNYFNNSEFQPNGLRILENGNVYLNCILTQTKKTKKIEKIPLFLKDHINYVVSQIKGIKPNYIYKVGVNGPDCIHEILFVDPGMINIISGLLLTCTVQNSVLTISAQFRSLTARQWRSMRGASLFHLTQNSKIQNKIKSLKDRSLDLSWKTLFNFKNSCKHVICGHWKSSGHGLRCRAGYSNSTQNLLARIPGSTLYSIDESGTTSFCACCGSKVAPVKVWKPPLWFLRKIGYLQFKRNLETVRRHRKRRLGCQYRWLLAQRARFNPYSIPLLKGIYSQWRNAPQLIPNNLTELFCLFNYLFQNPDCSKEHRWIILSRINYLFLAEYGRALPPVFRSKPSITICTLYHIISSTTLRSVKYCKCCRRDISRDGNACLNIAKSFVYSFNFI